MKLVVMKTEEVAASERLVARDAAIYLHRLFQPVDLSHVKDKIVVR